MNGKTAKWCPFVLGLVVFFVGPTTLCADNARRVLIIVGPSTHPPQTHEVAAGARLIKAMLAQNPHSKDVQVDIINGWPENESVLDAANSIVFTGDTFPPQRMPDTNAKLQTLERVMARGCGIVCIHYSTGLWGEDVPADGDHPLLRWLGGYFANKTCAHHQGIARVFKEAVIKPVAPAHPISRGWSEFVLHDEPYINNYFGKNNNLPGENVTILATSLLPPESPKEEPVSWCIQRLDGGRGFAIVMPHFYKNWSDDDLRCFILNGIVWTAGLEVPDRGVRTEKPELQRYLD